MVSTVVVSGSTNVASAQSTGGVTGDGIITLECNGQTLDPRSSQAIHIRAAEDETQPGVIESGNFAILGAGFLISGSITGGSFNAAEFNLVGVVEQNGASCGGTGQAVSIQGTCNGNNDRIIFNAPPLNGPGGGDVQCIVPDRTPPVITVPNLAPVQATGPGGAMVTYTVTATDDVDAQVTPICTPASGSTFPVGSTTVTCTATDIAGNVATKTFTVTVTPQPLPPIPTPPPDSACGSTGGGNSIITGTNGADTLIGTSGSNIMNGLAGNDAMNGCGGNDSVNGNAGNDGISGGTGNDRVSGGNGDDNVQGGEGNDIVSGDGGGTNTLTGGPGRDRFVCGPNRDTVTDFQPGQDVMIGNCILGPLIHWAKSLFPSPGR